MIKTLESSFTGLILCISLFVFLLIDKSFDKKINNYFIIGIVAIFLLILSDAGTYICANFPYVDKDNFSYLIMGRNISSFFVYSLRPLVVYCFACIIDKKRFARKEKIAPILLLLSSVNNFVSMFSGHIFKFGLNETKNAVVYYSGPVHWIPIAVLIIYAIYFCFVLISSYKRQNLGFIILAWIGIFLATGLGLLEMLMPNSIVNFLFNSYLAVMLVMFYIYLHVENYKRDALTGLYTRKQMYNFFESHKKNEMQIILLDINNLKMMNDTKGHEYGDKAIIKVANSIRDCADKKTQVYRIGGDEFVIISLNSIEQVDELCNKLEAKLNMTDIAVAYGRSIYHPGETFGKACARADVCMYDSKTASKIKENSN